MMVTEPDRFIDAVADAGADVITVHAEACLHLHRVVHQIKETGKRAGVAINPSTPVSAIEEVLPDLDLVLVMTVNPGYGGQAYIDNMEPKIARVRALIDDNGPLDGAGGRWRTQARDRRSGRQGGRARPRRGAPPFTAPTPRSPTRSRRSERRPRRPCRVLVRQASRGTALDVKGAYPR